MAKFSAWQVLMRLGRWFRRWLAEGEDKSLTVTGYRYTQPGPYEPQKASAGYRRSRSQTQTGRKYRAATGEPEPSSRLLPMRRAK